MAREQQPDLKLTPLACRLQSSRSIHCAKRLLRETGDCISFAMPSVEPAIVAIAAVNREIQGSDRDQLGRNAARGVLMASVLWPIHQKLLSWTLDDLETAEAMAVQN